MTAKEYLRQIYILDQKIRRLQERREQLRADLYSVGSPSNMNADRVQSSVSGDTMERLIARVDKIDRQIMTEMEKLITRRGRIAREIETLPDERYRQLLTYRYVYCQTWERIAEAMDVSTRHVYRMHGDALQAFRRVMK